MTREEAVEILSRPFNMKNVPAEIIEAHELAIKALEQEPCKPVGNSDKLDCISRQAVLEITAETGALETQARVKALPPVTPQESKTRWIPVSERLPNNYEDALVCYSQGGIEVAYYHIDDTYYPTEYADLNETGWFNEDGDALYFEPIAWQPLPKPFKESEE